MEHSPVLEVEIHLENGSCSWENESETLHCGMKPQQRQNTTHEDDGATDQRDNCLHVDNGVLDYEIQNDPFH